MYHKSVDGIYDVGGKIFNAKALGTVSAKNLVLEAQKAQSPISSTSNFLARDAEQIAAKAKQYNIDQLGVTISDSSNQMVEAIGNVEEGVDDTGEAAVKTGDIIKANLLSDVITKGLEKQYRGINLLNVLQRRVIDFGALDFDLVAIPRHDFAVGKYCDRSAALFADRYSYRLLVAYFHGVHLLTLPYTPEYPAPLLSLRLPCPSRGSRP